MAHETTTAGFASSFDQVSAALGTNVRLWRAYAKRPGFPAKVPGKGYDLAALAAWKAENIKLAPASGDLAARKAAKLDLEAELLRLRIEKEKRLSVLRTEVDELHGRMAMKLRAFLYAKLENEMPPKFAGCDAPVRSGDGGPNRRHTREGHRSVERGLTALHLALDTRVVSLPILTTSRLLSAATILLCFILVACSEEPNGGELISLRVRKIETSSHHEKFELTISNNSQVPVGYFAEGESPLAVTEIFNAGKWEQVAPCGFGARKQVLKPKSSVVCLLHLPTIGAEKVRVVQRFVSVPRSPWEKERDLREIRSNEIELGGGKPRPQS